MAHIVRDYFDSVASQWAVRDKTFDTYPAAEVRETIVTTSLNAKYPREIRLGTEIMDLGCGAGQLVIKLNDLGFHAKGVDISPKMIAEARAKLSVLHPEEVFKVQDATLTLTHGRHDVVTAMGLFEYLPYTSTFLLNLAKNLQPRGVAYIECRNRLFNAVTANDYTLKITESGDLKDLIRQLDDVEKYSSVTDLNLIKKSISWSYMHAGRVVDDENSTPSEAKEVKYARGMKRLQHTPEEIDRLSSMVGLQLKNVVYYHFHPFLPKYERMFPRLFNSIAYNMQPLGYTVLGATMCSAFVAILEKPL